MKLENMTYYIIDNNLLEDATDIEELMFETKDLRESAYHLLNIYYDLPKEAVIYGDCIEDLLKYIPDEKLKDLIENYNYSVFCTLEEAKDFFQKSKEDQQRWRN